MERLWTYFGRSFLLEWWWKTDEDVVGIAKGFSYGPAFKFEYVLLVPVKGKNIKIAFDDWIIMQDKRVAINRAIMTKFGFKVAELTVMFIKN